MADCGVSGEGAGGGPGAALGHLGDADTHPGLGARTARSKRPQAPLAGGDSP